MFYIEVGICLFHIHYNIGILTSGTMSRKTRKSGVQASEIFLSLFHALYSGAGKIKAGGTGSPRPLNTLWRMPVSQRLWGLFEFWGSCWRALTNDCCQKSKALRMGSPKAASEEDDNVKDNGHEIWAGVAAPRPVEAWAQERQVSNKYWLRRRCWNKGLLRDGNFSLECARWGFWNTRFRKAGEVWPQQSLVLGWSHAKNTHTPTQGSWAIAVRQFYF